MKASYCNSMHSTIFQHLHVVWQYDVAYPAGQRRTVCQDVRPWDEELNVGDARPDRVRHTSTLTHCKQVQQTPA